MSTKIEWADKTWNPITGCTPISEGCQNCYAERMSKRLAGRFGYPKDEPFKPGVVHEDKLYEPLKWRKPRRIFVSSMGDIFHEAVAKEALFEVFNTMASWAISCRKKDCDHEEVECWHDPGHTYMILTKRPENIQPAFERMFEFASHLSGECALNVMRETDGWPLSNVWLGVTAENQRTADERIPILLQIPAAVRFVSVEPMLGPVDISPWMASGYLEPPHDDIINWVICGGETGPGARPMHREWALNLKNQCVDAGVPFFYKGWGDWYKKYTLRLDRLLDGREWNEYPESIGG